jgi:protein-S-isoprenylcysteine O-methyltransferase Ste14
VQAIEFSRWFLALFFTAVGLFYTLAILRKTRLAGRSPVTRGEPRSLHRLIHDTFAAFRAAILLVCIARVPFPTIDAWLLPIHWLWQPAVILGGNALMLVSFAAILVVHAAMAADWRSGIDVEKGPARLIETGAFAVTRNPTFVCIQAAQLGLFLSLPSVFTLICLIVGALAIHMQVRLEERWLEDRFGETWRRYASRVPRWLFPDSRRHRERRG